MYDLTPRQSNKQEHLNVHVVFTDDSVLEVDAVAIRYDEDVPDEVEYRVVIEKLNGAFYIIDGRDIKILATYDRSISP